jgi:hypothetical protein
MLAPKERLAEPPIVAPEPKKAFAIDTIVSANPTHSLWQRLESAYKTDSNKEIVVHTPPRQKMDLANIFV